MPSKSESSDAQSGNPSLSGSSFTPESGKPESPVPSLLLLSKPGGQPAAPRGCCSAIASYQSVRAMHPLQPRSGDLQPDLAVLAGCYSLLFRRPCSQKARISAAYVNPFAVFSVHISENSGSGSGGELR
jgi:hypothetical protein